MGLFGISWVSERLRVYPLEKSFPVLFPKFNGTFILQPTCLLDLFSVARNENNDRFSVVFDLWLYYISIRKASAPPIANCPAEFAEHVRRRLEKLVEKKYGR